MKTGDPGLSSIQYASSESRAGLFLLVALTCKPYQCVYVYIYIYYIYNIHAERGERELVPYAGAGTAGDAADPTQKAAQQLPCNPDLKTVERCPAVEPDPHPSSYTQP